MKFGKELNLDNVDFNLSFNMDKSVNMLKPQEYLCDIKLGATGWGNKDWKGILYPKTAKPKDYLPHYSKSFKTIELNTTHYRIPTKDQVSKWKDQVDSDFKFCPKVLQLISHSRDLGANSNHLINFLDAISNFEDNLGPCFLQLPPYFDTSRLSVLYSFLDRWPSGWPLSLEFRHESFYNNNEVTDNLNEILHSKSIGKVLVDVAGRRDLIQNPILTSPDVIIRFVGNFPHYSDHSRITEWLKIFSFWITQGVRNIYFMIHQSEEMAVLQTAQKIIENWNAEKLTLQIMPLRWIDGYNPLDLQP